VIDALGDATGTIAELGRWLSAGLAAAFAASATLPSQNREFAISEAHPDADLVKVTRTTTANEPAAKASEPSTVKRRNHVLLWILCPCLVVALVVGGVIYMNAQDTLAMAQQGAVADQGGAQSLAQKAATAQQAVQQSADRSQSHAQALADNAATDSIAAKRAALRANAAGRGAGTPTN
jgi:hypothetical protein